MKVESVATSLMPTAQTDEMPVIKADQIKSILYLGIRGDIQLETGKKHSVDTYA